MDPTDRTNARDSRPIPRRIHQGAALILAGFVVMYVPYFITGEEWPQFNAIGRVFASLPVASGYAGVALGVAYMILGCIDHAHRGRD